MLLSIFQRELVFTLSGKSLAQTKTTMPGPARNCRSGNGKKKNGNSKIMLIVIWKPENSVLDHSPSIRKSTEKIAILIMASHESKYYSALVLLPNFDFL